MASQPVEKPSLATPALASVRDAVRRLPGSKIREIADLITVLNRGQILAEGSADEIVANAAVREVYLEGVGE